MALLLVAVPRRVVRLHRHELRDRALFELAYASGLRAEELVGVTSKAKSAKDPDVQKEMEAELAKLLKVDAIDWNKQIVLGVISMAFGS